MHKHTFIDMYVRMPAVESNTDKVIVELFVSCKRKRFYSLKDWRDFVFFRDICDNLHLRSIPANAFIGMTSEYTTM